MKTYFHILTLSGDSTIGGMEGSVRRIASYLANSDNMCTVYSRIALHDQPEERIEYQVLGEDSDHYLEPMRGNGASIEIAERARVDGLVFRARVERAADEHSSWRHVIVSFYISGAGFIAQRVADALGLQHIACVRGGDFSKDCHSPPRFSAAQYVLERASWVVTTNRYQEQWIRQILGRTGSLGTIYNSAPAEAFDRALWKVSQRGCVRLIADCGLSHKKATHVLLEAFAFASASTSGTPIYMNVAGPIEPSQENYWRGLVEQYEVKSSGRFRYLGQICLQSLLDELLESDIYCSATLGEGCSNGAIKALVLGMPIVATRTGVLQDLASDASHVTLVPAGSRQCLERALREKVSEVHHGSVCPDTNRIQRWRKMLTPAEERDSWERVMCALTSE